MLSLVTMTRAAWLVLLLALLATSCRGVGSSAPGLLGGIEPRASTGVTRAEVVTDGVIAHRGDSWDSHVAAVLGRGAFLEWDLGASQPIRSLYLQGDQNDQYIVSASEDGASWTPIWTAPPTGGRGLQGRSVDLDARARYLRLTVGSGDGSFSVAELGAFAEPAAAQESAFSVTRGLPAAELQRSAILLLGLALVAFVVVAQRGRPWLGVAALLLPLLAGWRLFEAFSVAWPVGQREVSMVRATAAFVALAALAREVLFPKRFPASRPAVIGTLAVCAFAALAAFANLGYPQFWDAKNARPNVVHNHDMRVYYPVAKYFHELHFDGVYLASVAAYVDDVENATVDSLANTQLRDLRTHHMRRVAEVEPEIEAVRKRFSPERWQSFVRDMRYFRETMGSRGYLDSMTDHGGNATPVWLAVAHLIFAKTTATNTTLLWTALLDPLLLLVAFVAIWRTFGLRTMLVSMIVFGANDFYMFGSNWAGATLRHDWMAYLALGACALRRERWMLGGALLALSAMIRAFPAFALIGAALPALWWLGGYLREHKKLPRLSEIRDAQRPLLRIALGALVSVAVFFLLSSALFSFGAWSEWLHKVSILDRDPHTNHVSLRGLVAGNDALHLVTLRARLPLYIALASFYALLIVLAARGKQHARAAVLGTLLIPVAFNPANYYIHFIFVLPLLAVERGREPLAPRDFSLWAILLTVCVAQYWTVLAPGWELHFQLATVILFAGITALLTAVIGFDWNEGARAEAAEPAPAPDAPATAAEDAPDGAVAR